MQKGKIHRTADKEEDEIKNAAFVLGYEWNVMFSGEHRVPSLDDYSQRDIMERMEMLLPDQIDIVFLPSPSLHQDHRKMFEAGIAMCNILCLRFGATLFLAYDSEYYGWEQRVTDHSTMFFVLSKEDVDKKIQAMVTYKSQLGRAKIFDPNIMLNQCIVTGSMINELYAESFSILREVRR